MKFFYGHPICGTLGTEEYWRETLEGVEEYIDPENEDLGLESIDDMIGEMEIYSENQVYFCSEEKKYKLGAKK